MRLEKTEDRGEQAALARALAQVVGSEPGEGEQPLRAVLVLQDPDQRGECQRLGFFLICFQRLHRLHRHPLQWERGEVAKRVLVVEDNELNLKLFCDLLRAHGYSAEPVRDGREAVDRARAFAPDLIIMDIQLPHVSGLELIETIKGDDDLKAIPIMAVTAYAAKGDEERIRALGAEAYVSKPISVLKFVDSVGALL